MTSQPEAARIARRVVQAAESASFASLSMELILAEQLTAEQLAGEEEERLELLGAIAREMRAALDTAQSTAVDVGDALEPHLALLRHLSQSRTWLN